MASADRQMIGDATARICGKRRRQGARVLQEWNDLFGASRDRGLVGHHLVAADTQDHIPRHPDLPKNAPPRPGPGRPPPGGRPPRRATSGAIGTCAEPPAGSALAVIFGTRPMVPNFAQVPSHIPELWVSTDL